jgi:hypothetical protein|tara:strand:+ start:580 stop:1185 length:606 start_codon:yes stop_codon:yes gene_type:complete
MRRAGALRELRGLIADYEEELGEVRTITGGDLLHRAECMAGRAAQLDPRELERLVDKIGKVLGLSHYDHRVLIPSGTVGVTPGYRVSSPRFGEWVSDIQGVRCPCGRSSWAWTATHGPTSSVRWWRVCCERCRLVSLVPSPLAERISKLGLDRLHREQVEGYSSGPPPITLWLTAGGHPADPVEELLTGAVTGLPMLREPF